MRYTPNYKAITHYYGEDGNIRKYYSDGSIEHSTESIKEVEEEMIKEAEERDENPAILKVLKKKRREAILTMPLVTAGLTITALVASKFSRFFAENFKYFEIGFLSGFLMDMPSNLKEIVKSTNAIQELKKYSIYLKMRKQMEYHQYDPALYEGTKVSEAPTINTIDDYSLRTVSKIAENLKLVKSYHK